MNHHRERQQESQTERAEAWELHGATESPGARTVKPRAFRRPAVSTRRVAFGAMTEVTSPPPPASATRLIWAAIVLGCAAACVAMGWAVVQRVGYPFELEWMEGSMVDHTARVVNGEPIYCAPTVDHVPYLYTPLYFYLSALASTGLGLDFAAPRLVNLVSMLGALALLAFAVRMERGRWLPGLLAAAVPIAGYGYVDSWYDLSRNDGPFYLLVMATIIVLRHASLRWLPLAGALAALAFLAKQSAVFVLPSLCLGALCLGAKRGVLFGIWATLALGLTVGGFHLATDGWFTFFVFEMPAAHGVNDAITLFWTDGQQGIVPLWPAGLAAAGLVAAGLRARWPREPGGDPHAARKWMLASLAIGAASAWIPLANAGLDGSKWLALSACVLWPVAATAWGLSTAPLGWKDARCDARRGQGFWAVQVVGLFALAWISRRHAGGHVNAFIPALMAAGVVLGSAAATAATLAKRAPLWLGATAILTGLVLWNLRYDPGRFVPRDANRANNEQFAAWLQSFEGDAFVLYHGHLAARAGKARTAHAQAVADLIQHKAHAEAKGHESRGWASFAASIAEAGQSRRFSAVVLDGSYLEVARMLVMPLITGMRPVAPPPLDRPAAMQPSVGMRNAYPQVFLSR